MIDKLQSLLDKSKAEYFTAEELTLHRRWGIYIAPPVDYMSRILPTVCIADCIRRGFGGPVRVSSGYRSPEYNKLVGGSPSSEHVEFRALDLQPHDSGRMGEFRVIAVGAVAHARHRGLNVALIHYSSFIHIDVGSPRRHNLDLDMRTK